MKTIWILSFYIEKYQIKGFFFTWLIYIQWWGSFSNYFQTELLEKDFKISFILNKVNQNYP